MQADYISWRSSANENIERSWIPCCGYEKQQLQNNWVMSWEEVFTWAALPLVCDTSNDFGRDLHDTWHNQEIPAQHVAQSWKITLGDCTRALLLVTKVFQVFWRQQRWTSHEYNHGPWQSTKVQGLADCQTRPIIFLVSLSISADMSVCLSFSVLCLSVSLWTWRCIIYESSQATSRLSTVSLPQSYSKKEFCFILRVAWCKRGGVTFHIFQNVIPHSSLPFYLISTKSPDSAPRVRQCVTCHPGHLNPDIKSQKQLVSKSKDLWLICSHVLSLA